MNANVLRIFTVCILFLYPLRGVCIKDPPTSTDVKKLNFSAEHVAINADGNLLIADRNVRLSLNELTFESRFLVLSIETKHLQIIEPKFSLTTGLTFRGSRLSFFPDSGELQLDEPQVEQIENGQTRIHAHQMFCSHGVCRLYAADGTSCPHIPTGFYIGAERVTIHKSGDIDFERLVLKLENTPVFALPWIRIRPLSKPGLLPPRLGWDQKAGFIFGPAGRLPLWTNAFVEGHIAMRSIQGLETKTVLVSPQSYSVIDYLLDIPKSDARLRHDLILYNTQTSLKTSLDLATSQKIVDNLATNPFERSITHTASRVLLTSYLAETIIESQARLFEIFDDQGEISSRTLLPSISFGFTLPSLPLADLFWPSLISKLTRFGFQQISMTSDFSNNQMPSHIRLEASPGIDLPWKLGPFNGTIRLGSAHQAWLIDGTDDKTPFFHMCSIQTSMGLPLVRYFHSWAHYIETFFEYLVVPWLVDQRPIWIMEYFEERKREHGVDVGLKTSLVGRVSNSVLSLKVKERLLLPGLGQPFEFSYLAYNGSVAVGWFHLAFDGSWDHSKASLSTFGVAIGAHDAKKGQISVGGRWLGSGEGPHRDINFGALSVTPVTIDTWPFGAIESFESFQKVEVVLSRHLTAHVGTRIGLWPAQSLHALWYGLDFHSSCKCLSVGIKASHRLDSLVPDVFSTFEIRGF